MAPLFVKLTPQRHTSDCLIACLSMLLGTSYEATLLAVSKVSKNSGTNGLHWSEAKAAAKLLGYKVSVRSKVDYANTVGVLACVPTKETQVQHAVFLLRGVIVDPEEGTTWDDWETYLEAHDMIAGSVLVRLG